MCLAQGQNAVTLVRLKPAALGLELGTLLLKMLKWGLVSVIWYLKSHNFFTITVCMGGKEDITCFYQVLFMLIGLEYANHSDVKHAHGL